MTTLPAAPVPFADQDRLLQACVERARAWLRATEGGVPRPRPPATPGKAPPA